MDYTPTNEDKEIWNSVNVRDLTGEDDDSEEIGGKNQFVQKDRIPVKELFDIPSKSEIKSHLLKLLKRLSPDEDSNQPQTVEAPPLPRKKMTLEEKFNFAVNKDSDTPHRTSVKTNMEKLLESEMTYLEKTKSVRGFLLEKCYNFLLTIKPTSVESERAFSVAGYTCTKIRSRFNDETLDKLCFLRHFLRNNSDK